MRARARGFTVVEALISISLTMLFVWTVSVIVRDTQLASLASRRQALDPSPQHLTQSLRSDIHRSYRVQRLRGAPTRSWSSSPLTLGLPDGGFVYYSKSVDEVARTVVASDGSLQGTRLLMRDVLGWRWLEVAPNLIEIEITYRRRPANESLRRDWRNLGPAVERASVRLAMRAVPGRRSW